MTLTLIKNLSVLQSHQLLYQSDLKDILELIFHKYSVPAWCTVGDMQLDLNATMSGFFVTSDCSNNEGLSFVISDFGIYFNETKINTLFETSENSIRANMEM